jgi:Zn-dependent oligopeptidase
LPPRAEIAAHIQTAFIDREIAKQQAQVDKITKHHAECKASRDVMVKALKDSVETMQDSVRYCSTMKQKTNSNISRLTRTMCPKEKDNFLKSGVQEKDHLLDG